MAVVLTRRGLKINVEKTKIMTMGRSSFTHQVTLFGERLEQISCFKYLDIHLVSDGRVDRDIDDYSGSSLFSIRQGFLNKGEISKRTKIAVYKSTFIPTLTFSSDFWCLTGRQRSRQALKANTEGIYAR